jgi:hypothetical protein
VFFGIFISQLNGKAETALTIVRFRTIVTGYDV